MEMESQGVIGDTQILTKIGYEPIKNYNGCHVEIWNGFEWVNVITKNKKLHHELLEITVTPSLDYTYYKCIT